MRHGKLDVEGGRWGLLQECLLGVVWLQQGRQNLAHVVFAVVSDAFPLRLKLFQPNICLFKVSQFPTVFKIILVCLKFKTDLRFKICFNVRKFMVKV